MLVIVGVTPQGPDCSGNGRARTDCTVAVVKVRNCQRNTRLKYDMLASVCSYHRDRCQHRGCATTENAHIVTEAPRSNELLPSALLLVRTHVTTECSPFEKGILVSSRLIRSPLYR